MLILNLAVFSFIDFILSLFKFEFSFINSAYIKCAFYGSLVSECGVIYFSLI
jgi:hypothetical protein